VLFRLFTVLAVAALAFSTWILSSPAHRPKAADAGAAADLPGYYLKDATLTDFDAAGNPSIHLHADRIDQIDHGSEVMLSTVRVDYQSPNGQNWVLFGDTARVQPGGTIIDVSDHVRLQGEATGRAGTAIVLTDALRYDVREAVASTRSDVRILFGAQTLTARGMVANLKERTMHLESKVNGRFFQH
jgi:LPS export ABC transporter protein LptC